MEKVTYIIPIHEYNEKVENYFKRAITGLKNLEGADTYEVIIVGTQDVLSKCETTYKVTKCPQSLTLLPTDEQDVFKKINMAVMKCVTPYFSILEFDDDFYSYWNTVAQKELSKERYSILLPINEFVKTDNSVPSLGNEIAWDVAFVDDLGFIGMKELEVFKDFNITGGYIKTDDFIALGGLKPSLKIAAWYEYLLRVAHNEKKIRVAPRIGYMHTIFREDSYMMKAQDEITQEEGAWLVKEASKVYKDKNDTGKVFGVK